MILESLSFTKTLFAFDFDGTLSRIVRDPSAAVMSKTTTELVKDLSEVATIAIVSGRGIEDLRSRLDIKVPNLIGNHGLEGLKNSSASLDLAKSCCAEWKRRFTKVKFSSGVEIEDKTYSLAIHYRKSRTKGQDKKLIWESVTKLDPSPRIILGKSVVNLVPAGAPHKGMALLELMRQTGVKHAFYIGDDDTDEDVFGLPDYQIVTVRVGYKRTSRARFYIQRQSEINRLLKTIVRFHTVGKK